ncbi:MAG: F0F1 ATP synthase subunit A [Alphaproteobacteria bacterium]|nr:F0F1 ATP synthase subunit A [Alphaproteobacteria bacterium]
MAASLLEEFKIHDIGAPLFSVGGHAISFNTSALFMIVAICACTALMVLAMRPQAVVPGRWQILAEKLYDLVTDMLESGAGERAKPFFPLLFTIFTFVLFCNLFGMFPGSLSVTSHFIVNLAIALFLFVVIIIAGFVRHGWHFLMLFTPAGIPKVLILPMTLIEFISFAVRPFTLTVRLFANMLAGHILLQVFSGMVIGLLTAGWLAGLSILPMAANIAMTGFEFFVAFLQAYIYAILASVYLRDAIEMHG